MAKKKRKADNRKGQQPQYPIGTVAMYGPDDKTTMKIAAGIILHDGAEPILKRWVATDVTTNPKVQQEMKEFFLQHGVTSVVMSQGSMGCPHEEGEDFLHGVYQGHPPLSSDEAAMAALSIHRRRTRKSP
jgi:hypothetical protein